MATISYPVTQLAQQASGNSTLVPRLPVSEAVSQNSCYIKTSDIEPEKPAGIVTNMGI